MTSAISRRCSTPGRGLVFGVFAVAVSVSAALIGCSGKTGAGTKGAGASGSDIKKDLSTLGRAYSDYIDAHRKGPADWQTLIDASPKHADALQRLRDGGVTVKWGVRFRDATQGSMNFVLAEKPGGPKLMLDGSVAE
jgi:hypothetical protein